ncbi:MAG: hypothetical protein LBT37_05060 [Lactobacillaceae bacterium]|jgi:hypothetical protein|nr:hypothetical protein [Lactobacillaceae bacterium]
MFYYQDKKGANHIYRIESKNYWDNAKDDGTYWYNHKKRQWEIDPIVTAYFNSQADTLADDPEYRELTEQEAFQKLGIN